MPGQFAMQPRRQQFHHSPFETAGTIQKAGTKDLGNMVKHGASHMWEACDTTGQRTSASNLLSKMAYANCKWHDAQS